MKININDGTAEMTHAHVDEGWIKKWAKRDKPVNFLGQGYLAAAFAAITSSPMSSYKADEMQSIVSGAPVSKFSVIKK